MRDVYLHVIKRCYRTEASVISELSFGFILYTGGTFWNG